MSEKHSAERVRADVPGLEGIAFFNAASMGAPPRIALDAVAEKLRHLRHGPAGHSWAGYVEEFEDGVAAARREGARLLGASEDEVALAGDTTSGLHHAMQAIPFRAGDNMIVSDLEYPSVALAAMDAARDDGVEVRFFPNRGGRVTVDDYRAAIDGRTRAILASSVSWVTGERLDLAALSELANERGVFLVVDAVQQLGALPIDTSRLAIDFLASGAYKWLNAPFGVGLLYVARGAHEKELRVRRLGLQGIGPPAEGWGKFFESPDLVPVPELPASQTAMRFDPQGTPPRLGSAGLAAALAWRNAMDARGAEEHILGLAGEIIGELEARKLRVFTPRAESERAGIVTFSIDGEPKTDRRLRKFLEDRKIFTTVRYCSGVGGVRAAVHVYTTREEVRQLLAAVDEFRR
jgi:selenocysteine lyase/cysteine desulfurase